jgi:hypothetical protein
MRTRARAARLNAEDASFDRLGMSADAESAVSPRRVLCLLSVLALLASAVACGATTGLFRQYEYEEEIYLAIDGTATVYVNSSLAALNALRGTAFDVSPTVRADVAAIRAYYSGAGARVSRVSQSRRNNRRYVHVRLDIDDVRRLGDLGPFAWSKYRFVQDGSLFVYQQTVGAAGGKDGGAAGWNGRETVAFRLHLPSKIRYHNTGREVGRGNILVWEQPFTERLRSVPLVLEARMDAQSILYRTLWLFGITFLAVAAVFVVVIWWVMRRGSAPPVEPAR